MKIVQEQLLQRLNEHFAPVFIETVNESHMHNVPAGSESHFKVTLVSDAFENVRSVKRHQAVYGVVGELMGAPIHALALHTFSPSEWERSSDVPDSPNCRGGSQ